jgi:hypothetical protein
MDYELQKMGQKVLMVSSRKLFWKLHIWADKTHTKSQTVYQVGFKTLLNMKH